MSDLLRGRRQSRGHPQWEEQRTKKCGPSAGDADGYNLENLRIVERTGKATGGPNASDEDTLLDLTEGVWRSADRKKLPRVCPEPFGRRGARGGFGKHATWQNRIVQPFGGSGWALKASNPACLNAIPEISP